MIGVVCAAPWWFGAVQAAVQVWVLVAVASALLCWLVKQWSEAPGPLYLPLAAVPLAGALALGALQLTPLSPATLRWLSPVAAELELGNATGPHRPIGCERAAPISVYPASTRRDLALLTLAVAVFALGTAFFRTPASQIALCGLVALNGAAFTFLAFAQRLTGSGMLYWSVPLTQGGGPFGAFVNQNNAGGFLNLSLAAAAGWTLWAWSSGGNDGGDWAHGSAGRGPTSNGCDRGPICRIGSRSRVRSALAARVQRLRDFVARLDATILTAASATGLIAAGVLCSLSRGAVVAMVGGAIVTVVTFRAVRRRTPRFRGLVAVALTALFLVSWIGMRPRVAARLATLMDRELMADHALLLHWHDGLGAAADFWPSGSGLGTYRYVYRLYQQEPNRSWFYHAENHYLEALVDAGVPGLALMLAAIGAVGLAAIRVLQRRSDRAARAVGLMALLALSTQAIHAFFDFGLYIPANMMLLALISGVVVAVGARRGEWAVSGGLSADWFRRAAGSVPVAALLIATLWGAGETRGLAAWERAERQTRWAQQPEIVPVEQLQQAIQLVGATVQRRPDDAEAHYRLAQLWIHRYRVNAWAEARDLQRAYGQRAARTEEGEADPLLWPATSLISLHAVAHQWAEYDRHDDLQRLRSDPAVRQWLAPAAEHLRRARAACALLPRVHLTLAELAVLNDPAEEAGHLQRARRLAPADPHLLFRTGVLEYQAGRWDQACDDWRRSLELSSAHLNDLLGMAGGQVSYWHMAERILPDRPELLIWLARQQHPAAPVAAGRRPPANPPPATAAAEAFRKMLIDRAQRLVDQADLPDDERHYTRAAVMALQQQYELAIGEYQQAVAMRPEALQWRYELAQLLTQQGQLAQAHEHARYCARMAPRDPDYRKLLEEIHHKRLAK